MLRSRGTVHVLDLDAGAYERRPGPTSEAFAHDNQTVTLTRIDVWPEVDGRMLLWFDDPAQPEVLEHHRVSSRIRSVTRDTLTPAATAPTLGPGPAQKPPRRRPVATMVASMGKITGVVMTGVVAAVFGFAGAGAAIVVFQDELRGDRGVAGADGEPGPPGPPGPVGAPGPGVDRLAGGFVVEGFLGCPPGTSQFGVGSGSVVTDVTITPPIEGFSAGGAEVSTRDLCRILGR